MQLSDNKKKKKLFLGLTFSHLFILEGFRNLNFGQDAWYQDLYKTINIVPWSRITDFSYYIPVKSELGYIVLNKVLYTLSPDVQTLYIFISFVYLFAVYKYIKNYSLVPVLSVFVFFVVFWFQSFYVLRQYLAISLCLLAIPYVIKREAVKFGLLMFVAFFIHQTSIVFVPVYFIFNYKFRFTVKTFIIYVAFCTVMMVALSVLLRFAVSNLSGYESYMDREVETAGNFKMALVYIFFFLSYSFFVKKEKETIVQNLFFKMLAIAVVFQLAGSTWGMMQRINLYYALSLLAVIPTTVKFIGNKGLRLSFVCFTLLLYMYIMYLDFEKDRYSVTPYSSILF